MKDVYLKLHNLLGDKVKGRLAILTILPVIGSFFETFGISAVVSFITVILNEDVLENNRIISELYDFLDFHSYSHFVIAIAIGLILFYVVKTVYLSFQYWVQNLIVKNVKKEVSLKVLNILLHKPYEYFTNVNTAEILRIMDSDVLRCLDYLMITIQIFTEAMVILFLLGMLLLQNAKMTLFVVSFLTIFIGGMRIFTKKKIAHSGKINQEYTREKYKWLNQSVYGIKEIKIAQNEMFFFHKYEDVMDRSLMIEMEYGFWLKIPQYLIEMIIMVCILLYVILMSVSGIALTEMVASMTTFALAAIRLLPACNRVTNYMTQLSYRKGSLDLISGILNEQIEPKKEDRNELTVQRNISIKNLSFKYKDGAEDLFTGANMEIKTGTTIGIMGPSGAGKTTLIDLVLGLLKPYAGGVYADDINIEEGYRGYLDKIAYIPQGIFLSDDSIRNNVAFGVDESDIEDEKVVKALEEAQLIGFVNSLPDGMDTMVGEQGARISGGQKQRIGIARALYKNPEVLVLDEATSALDNETEAAIMESIRHLKGKKTMIIIAHRLSTIKDCDVIYEVKDGQIKTTTIDERDYEKK
jgi:ABC-type bacteriocin/lantibiotic exporter with double-glycine peptidase domain